MTNNSKKRGSSKLSVQHKNPYDKPRYKEAETPLPAYQIDNSQIEYLLEKVNADHSFLEMA